MWLSSRLRSSLCRIGFRHDILYRARQDAQGFIQGLFLYQQRRQQLEDLSPRTSALGDQSSGKCRGRYASCELRRAEGQTLDHAHAAHFGAATGMARSYFPQSIAHLLGEPSDLLLEGRGAPEVE